MSWNDIVNSVKGIIGTKFSFPTKARPLTQKDIEPTLPLKIDFTNARVWTYIVMHHSYSPDSANINDWEGIRKYHTSWRFSGNTITEQKARELIKQGEQGVEAPWPTIGYHFGVEEDRKENPLGEYVYRLGCSLARTGYHTKGFNEKAIGICLVGNYGGNFDGKDGREPTEVQIIMLEKLVKYLMWKFQIPASRVLGHRETYKMLDKPQEKTCPGTHFDMLKFRQGLL